MQRERVATTAIWVWPFGVNISEIKYFQIEVTMLSFDSACSVLSDNMLAVMHGHPWQQAYTTHRNEVKVKIWAFLSFF